MRIIQQPFTKQEMITTLGTNLRMMGGKVENEAMTGDEEQIRIIIRQTGKSIEGEAIDGHKHGSRIVYKTPPNGCCDNRNGNRSWYTELLPNLPSILLDDQFSQGRVAVGNSEQ
jgi:hypothetical protein